MAVVEYTFKKEKKWKEFPKVQTWYIKIDKKDEGSLLRIILMQVTSTGTPNVI